MRSRLRVPAAVALALAALACAAGCYWTKYDKLTRTHVQLLLAMAEKLVAVTREQDGPPAALAEYRYPLERARDFTRIVDARFHGRRSLDAFRAFCDAYEEVLRAAERVEPGAPVDAAADLERALARLRAAAAAVREALDAEARGPGS